jgi:amino-acid N-acetyltransferase
MTMPPVAPAPKVGGVPVIRAARAADRGALLGLLGAAHLPTAGISATLTDYLVAELPERIVGAIGLEVYGTAALLRSAVVAANLQGVGLGRQLVYAVLSHAAARGVRDVYLLTTTAEAFFPRFGFERITRDEVAAGVRDSVEFREACPASATVMRARLALP